MASKREYSEREIELCRDAYSKLDGMPLSFGIPRYTDEMEDADVIGYIGRQFADVLRELNVQNLDGVAESSPEELQIVNRIVYHSLKKFRLSASVFFKFSTAVDGKTVDKQQIPKMMAELIKEYNDEWTSWRRTISTGSIWQMERTVATNGDYSTSSS